LNPVKKRTKLGKYRVAAGHYEVGEYVIYGCYPRWQVRDGNDDLLEDFATLREAIQYARSLRATDVAEAVLGSTNPDVVELRAMLAGPER
jgi:hypothetical protein